jgi:hypothetical protein
VQGKSASLHGGLIIREFCNASESFLRVVRARPPSSRDRLLASTEPHENRSLADQLRAGLNAHIQYFVDHPREAVTVNRGALSDDPAIQAIITEEPESTRPTYILVYRAMAKLYRP